MKTTKVKTFIQAINEFFSENLSKKGFFKDMRPTLVEKKIIEGWFLLRDSSFDAILETIPKLNASYDEFVEAQKLYLWGTALNNKSLFEEATGHLKQAYYLVKGYELDWIKFKVMNTLFITYFNSKKIKEMHDTLQVLGQLEISKNEYLISYLQAQFLYYSYKEDSNKAAGFLDLMEKNKKKMTERETVNFWVMKFNFFFKLEHFEKCAHFIEQMKQNRKFQYGANTLYTKVLFENFWQNKPIYINDKNFKPYPHLYHQLMVIKNLEAVQVEEATSHWTELRKAAPHAYGEAFQLTGDKNIFSMCLKKYESVWKSPSVGSKIKNLPQNKTLAFYEILKAANAPVRHEDIYKSLWGKDLVEKSDKDKLKRIASRAREEFGIEIQTKKGCYVLSSSSRKSA